MKIELLDIVQTIVSLVLIPIWKSIYDLKVIMAKEYMTKTECQAKHAELHDDINRIHERIDDKKDGA